MLQGLIGKKIDQTQTFLEDGRRIPVTEVSVTDNVVLQVKTPETDKYTAVQLGFGVKKNPIKARTGHAKKAGVDAAPQTVREVAWEGDEEMPKAGEVVTVEEVFKPGDIIKVTGTSKGKGFAGGVKRYNFRGGPKTHGQSDRHRAPGSIGQGTTPGRVYKGKRMAGHMGVDTVSVQNLVVVDVDSENKKLYVLGLVPGHKNAMIVLTKTGEQKKFTRLLSAKLKEDAEAAEEAKRLEAEQAKAAEEAAKAEAEKPAETPVEEVTVEEAAVTEAKEETPVAVEATEEVKEEAAPSEEKAEEAGAEQAVKEGEENGK